MVARRQFWCGRLGAAGEVRPARVWLARCRQRRAAREGVPGECAARSDFTGGRVLTEISTSPGRPALQALLGQRVSSGFRSAVMAADARLSTEDGLLNLLLDDFPVATLVSGHAIGAGLATGTAGAGGTGLRYLSFFSAARSSAGL